MPLEDQNGTAQNKPSEPQPQEIPSPTQTPPVNPPMPENTSGQGKNTSIPPGVKGWSWGAFLLSFIWAVSNRVWFGLLTLIPYVGVIMIFVLGFKGREWAWKAKRWESVEQFNKVQRKWAVWGVILIGGAFVSIVLLVFLILFVNRPG